MVLFVHRPEAYNITEENGRPTEGKAEIMIGKQRNGPIGNVELSFIKQYARFENLTKFRDDQLPPPPPELEETPF